MSLRASRWILLLALLPACADVPTEPETGARFGNNKKTSNTDTDSRGIWTFYAALSDGATPTAIRGDGRSADGSGPADPPQYQNGLCGVSGKIFWYDPDFSRSGDATIDPNGDNAGACAPRTLYFDLGSGPVALAPFTNARQIMQLATGESRTQTMRWTVNLSECERLVATVVVTRLAGDTSGSPGAWTVESVAPHFANCEVWRKGKYVVLETGYTLPYSLRIDEVKYAG